MLVLPNAWDAASAKIVAQAGAAAIATTSGGVAHSHGYSDGNFLPRELAVSTVREICRVVHVPVSADIEAGFGASPSEVAKTVELICDAGAVGLNIEDGIDEPAVLQEKIRAIRQVDRDVFVNARIDVYLNGRGAEEEQIAESIRRAKLYLEAGADGVFVPALRAIPSIEELLAEVQAPLNLLLVPGLAAPAELEELGVARLSVGGLLSRAALGLVRRAAKELLADGSYDALFYDSLSHAELNGLFATRGE